VGDQVVVEIRRGQQVDLCLVVKSNLADGHQDTTSSRCGGAGKQSSESLLPVHLDQSIEGVLIAKIKERGNFSGFQNFCKAK